MAWFTSLAHELAALSDKTQIKDKSGVIYTPELLKVGKLKASYADYLLKASLRSKERDLLDSDKVDHQKK